MMVPEECRTSTDTTNKPRTAADLISRVDAPPTAFLSLIRNEFFAICALFITALLLRLLSYTGIIGSDDLGYSHFAQQVSAGTYHLFPHHYAIRYGIILPLGLLYHLFGVHEWTTVMLPILCSSITPPLLVLITCGIFPNCRVPWISGILLLTFPVDTHYGAIMVPEPVMQAMALISLMLLLEAERLNSSVMGMIAGLGLGFSYLAKEPGLIIGGAFLVFLVVSERFKLAGVVLIGMLFVIGSECLWYITQSGDLFFRTHALAAHNRSPEVLEANRNLTYRLLKGYLRMMLVPNMDFGLHSLLALACVGMASTMRQIRRQSGFLLVVLWAALPFLYLDFGSSSLTSYIALPMAPRYIGIVFTPLFCLAALIVSISIEQGRLQQYAAFAAVSAVCVMGSLCGLEASGTGYRTAEVREVKHAIAEELDARSTVCASAMKEEQRCLQIVEILQPDVPKTQGEIRLASIAKAFSIPQAEVKALVASSEFHLHP